MLVLAGLGGGKVAKLPLPFTGGEGLGLPFPFPLSAVVSLSVGGTPLVVGVAFVGGVVPLTFCDLILDGLGGTGFVADWEGNVAAPLFTGNADSALSCVWEGLPEVILPFNFAGFGLMGGRGLLSDPPMETSELVLELAEPTRVISKPLPLSLFCRCCSSLASGVLS